MEFEELWTELKTKNQLTDEYKKLAEGFFKLGLINGLLHAAEQDEKEANERTETPCCGTWSLSAEMHRQAASEVK